MEALYNDNLEHIFGKEYELNIEGYTININVNQHAINRQEDRGILEASILSGIRDSFDFFFGLDDQRFIIIDHALDVSIIGYIKQEYGEFYVEVISVVDSIAPTNPYHTVTIEVNGG